MKLEVKVTDITHDDLVNLFSTAIYGSYNFMVRKRKGDYYGTPLEDANDCREDAWAKILLAGGHVYVYDINAEDDDEFYGTLPHLYCESRESMRYILTLEDIRKALEKAFSRRDYVYDVACKFLRADDEDFDADDADTLMQYIVFGEVIYG